MADLEKRLAYLQDKSLREAYLDEMVDSIYGRQTRREKYKGMVAWASGVLRERADFSAEGPQEDKEGALLWHRLLDAMDAKIETKRVHAIHDDMNRRLAASETLAHELGQVTSALQDALGHLKVEEVLFAESEVCQTRRLVAESEVRILALQMQLDTPMKQEQRERIERNRQQAMERREAKRARVGLDVD